MEVVLHWIELRMRCMSTTIKVLDFTEICVSCNVGYLLKP